MREIKFRGQNNFSFNWIVGSLLIKDETPDKIMTYTGYKHEVLPETVGQYTGLKDKNGIEIYEGDVVRILYTDWVSKNDDDPRTLKQYLIDKSTIAEVIFNNNSWEVKSYSKKYDDYNCSSINCGTHGYIEIIGNIHENPELLCTSQSTPRY